jgi:hypothetical protein
MESDGWERYRIRMVSRIGNLNTRMGRAAAVLPAAPSGLDKLM